MLLPNVQDEPRPWLARAVLLGARIVTAMVVGSGALLGRLWFESIAEISSTSDNRIQLLLDEKGTYFPRVQNLAPCLFRKSSLQTDRIPPASINLKEPTPRCSLLRGITQPILQDPLSSTKPGSQHLNIHFTLNRWIIRLGHETPKTNVTSERKLRPQF